jgi:outer membrane protein OmpA-like peptidoglycan-associated protein
MGAGGAPRRDRAQGASGSIVRATSWIGAGWIGWVASSSAAWAQDPFPLDVELVRPGLSPAGGFAVDAPEAVAAGVASVGGLLQYEDAPLRLYDGDALLGALVGHRVVAQLHAGVSVSRRTSFSVVVPFAAHFGSSTVDAVGADGLDWARNGGGVGDLSVTARVHAGTWDRFKLGVLGTVLLPTGNRQQYMGEKLPRLRAGVLGATDFGRVRLQTNLLALLRAPVPTVFDFTAGPELQIDLGVQGEVLPGQLRLIGEWISRVGLAKGKDGGRFASEVIAGVRYSPRPDLRVDVALGKGLTEGYGTTVVRAMLGLTWVHVPKPKVEPAPVVVVVEEDEPLVDVTVPDPPPIEAPPPPPPPPPPMAQLAGEEIVFRDPIGFEQGSTVLLPSSGPVLDGVAEVIASHPEVGHVVIEGHASQEGGFQYNYTLSSDRARAIYEALIARGVHPKRLSYRGAGEVEGEVGPDGAPQAANRRVVFHVVRQYLPGEARPALSDTVIVPWTGEPRAVIAPPPGSSPEVAPAPEAAPAPAPEAAPAPAPEAAPAPAPESATPFPPPPSEPSP